MQTVLIIDTDLGFVFWLGGVLDDGGYRAIPARDVSDAISLVDQFKLEIDVLIVNLTLQKSAPFVEYLRRLNVKVIALTEDEEAPLPTHVDASRQRPSTVEESTGLEWLDLVKSVLDGARLKRALGSSGIV